VTRLLGIDLGSSRIGIALADTQTGQVRPLATLRRASSERDRESISRLATEHAVDEIIVGLPLSLDGRAGPQVTATRAWAESVLAAIGLPVAWRDERMTTERALERLGGASRGASGGPPSANARRAHRARLDREAAVLILQAEIDARAGRQHVPR
jgi:putative holliday junction resolvase